MTSRGHRPPREQEHSGLRILAACFLGNTTGIDRQDSAVTSKPRRGGTERVGVPTPAMSPTDLWCVVEPRLCQTGASRTRLPSVCPPWPEQVSWAPTLPLCVTSDWRHRALSPSARGEVLRTPDALGRRWARLTCGPRRTGGGTGGDRADSRGGVRSWKPPKYLTDQRRVTLSSKPDRLQPSSLLGAPAV